MNRIAFTCDICRGEIIFDDEDNPIINTCVCKDNPWRDFRADYKCERRGCDYG